MAGTADAGTGRARASYCRAAGTSRTVGPRAKGCAVPKSQWSDFGAIWKTIREVDINAIRHEADRGVAIVCIGQPAALWWVERYLRDGPNRYPLSADPLALVPLSRGGGLPRPRGLGRSAGRGAGCGDNARRRRAGWARASLDGAATEPGGAALRRGRRARRRRGPPTSTGARPRWWTRSLRPRRPAVGGAVLSALPAEARLAAARRLPGLRPWFAARLTSEVSVSNAAFALASGRAVDGAVPRHPHLGRRHRHPHQEPGADGLPAGPGLRGAPRLPEAHDRDHPRDRRRRGVAADRRGAGGSGPRLRHRAEDGRRLRRHLRRRAWRRRAGTRRACSPTPNANASPPRRRSRPAMPRR